MEALEERIREMEEDIECGSLTAKEEKLVSALSGIERVGAPEDPGAGEAVSEREDVPDGAGGDRRAEGGVYGVCV